VVELKIHGEDSAVGQVCRIAEAYATRQSLNGSTVRKAIGMFDICEELGHGLRGAGVERLCAEPHTNRMMLRG